MTTLTVAGNGWQQQRAARPKDDQLALAELVGDTALVLLLRGKPAEEAIPSSVWWLVAEALRTSVSLRRVLVAPALAADTEDLSALHAEARLLTDAALAELADETGARPTPTLASWTPTLGVGAGLQLSALHLARLLVSHRVTDPGILVVALSAHLRSLERCAAAIDAEEPLPA